ncbi:hypothetical protein DFH07DRAFT_120393 [Mycena maculata]|uniref:DUF6534 domain-containing protein n=1 Tax=Mycena maculata TaxID=230809 RepID=A0AAD7K215_9AGAR|nr:hypothetical protein DFH07DRAFT_120393 [Mycena maculata]
MASPAGSVPVPDPQALAQAIAEVKEVFATSFIGFAVATTAYGISILQLYLYFRNYPKDNLVLKLTVGTLWLLDTLSTIMVAHSLYTYFVLNFMNLAADALIPWSFALENGLLTGVTLLAQCYYSWQIWTISKNVLVTGVIFLLALAAFGLGLYVTVHLFRFPAVATLATHSVQVVTGPVQGMAGACDIAIMLALIYYLRSRRRSGVRTTEQMIDTLILYAMCRGIMTAITQILFLALNVGSPDHTYWQPFHQLVGKLYVNSILASLNVRKAVLGKGDPEKSFRSSGLSKSTAANTGTDSTRTMPLMFMAPKVDTITGTFETRDQDQDHVSDHQSHHDNAEILTNAM